MACDCKDEDEQKSAKFLIRLNTPVANLVEFQVYHSFDELCSLASKVERQQKEAKCKSFRSSIVTKSEATCSSPKLDNLDKSKTIDTSVVGDSKAKQGPLTLGQVIMKGKQCFKCQGHGNIARQCPNMVLVSLEEDPNGAARGGNEGVGC